jgi:hypothetical protein
MTTLSDFDEDALILRFSRRTPRNSNESLKPISETDPPTADNLQIPYSSSLGTLDKFPVEILHQIFNALDFRSLSRLASSSHYGRYVVRSHPFYRILTANAFPALVALNQTQIIQWYSSEKLYSVLQSESCVSCGEYAPYLFLPTCERCCYWCHQENQALWLVPLSKAKKLLGLKEKELKGMPIVRSLHGAQFIPPIRRGARERLVAGKTIKKIAVAAHGSEYALAQFILEQNYSINDKYLAMWIKNAPLEPLAANPSRLPIRQKRPTACNRYLGMGTIMYPTMLHGKEAEYGYWCLGCTAWYNNYRFDRHFPARVLDGMARRARSRTDFAEHINTCVGIQMLFSDDKEHGPWTIPPPQPPPSNDLYGEFGEFFPFDLDTM